MIDVELVGGPLDGLLWEGEQARLPYWLSMAENGRLVPGTEGTAEYRLASGAGGIPVYLVRKREEQTA